MKDVYRTSRLRSRQGDNCVVAAHFTGIRGNSGGAAGQRKGDGGCIGVGWHRDADDGSGVDLGVIGARRKLGTVCSGIDGQPVERLGSALYSAESRQLSVVRRIQHPFAIDGFRGLRAAGGAGARRRCFRGRCSGCRTAKYHACSQQHTGSTNNGVFHGCSLLCIDVQQRKPLSEHPSRFCSLKAGLHLLRGTRLSGISQPVFAFKISPKKMRLEPRSTTRKKKVHPMCWDAPLSGQ